MGPTVRQPHPADRDPDTIARMRARDPEGLRQLLEDYGTRVKWWLHREFRSLSEAEVEEALNSAAHAAWRAAPSFDPSRGTLRAWFYVIARNAGLEVVRREVRAQRHRPMADVDEVADPSPAPAADPSPAANERSSEFVEHLRACIQGLPRLQRSIIEADLQAGDVARAAELAESLRTTKNSIYVSRSIARKALRLCLSGRGHKFAGGEPPSEAETAS